MIQSHIGVWAAECMDIWYTCVHHTNRQPSPTNGKHSYSHHTVLYPIIMAPTAACACPCMCAACATWWLSWCCCASAAAAAAAAATEWDTGLAAPSSGRDGLCAAHQKTHCIGYRALRSKHSFAVNTVALCATNLYIRMLSAKCLRGSVKAPELVPGSPGPIPPHDWHPSHLITSPNLPP